MSKLRVKLALFNLLSKLVFTAMFLLLMPYLTERINLIQTDNNLIQKREQFISLISKSGIEPFIASDSGNVFGNYNIFKEEFISFERVDLDQDVNDIEVSKRIIEGEEIEYRVLDYSFKINGKMYLLEIGESLISIHQTENNIKKVMLVFLVLIVLITFLTDLQYTRRLLRPLDIITNKLKGISDPSIFDNTPVITTTADFIHLDNALIKLMASIDELFRKEKEITVNISHELLTPVSVLRSKLENLLIRKDIEPDIETKIEESLKTLNRLQNLINSLLLIARLESRQCLREDSISITEVLREVLGEISPIAEDSGIALSEKYGNDFQFKKANRPLIFSMFYNVVNNAVKNTPVKGEVIVITTFYKNRYSVTITDNGKGMTEAQMSTLFSRFKTRTENNAEGIGIGLAIAKSIADFHGIEISVKSEILKGTTFTFRFPENS
jgi:signal transduction histidine kinase